MVLVTRLPPEIEFEKPSGLAGKFLERKKLSAMVIVLSIIIVFIPAEFFADAMLELAAKTLIVTEVFLVAVVAPIISEMPEKLTAYIAATKSEDMARLGILNFMSTRINNGTLLISSMFLAALVAGHVAWEKPLPIGSSLVCSLLFLAGLLSLIGALTTLDRRITIQESIGLLVVYILSMFALEDPLYVMPIVVILAIIAVYIIVKAVKNGRFYWLEDLKHTIQLCKTKNQFTES